MNIDLSAAVKAADKKQTEYESPMPVNMHRVRTHNHKQPMTDEQEEERLDYKNRKET